MNKSLRKELTLVDVYAVSTGAMFSSGFFLLPGLAAAMTGTSAAWAYVAAGLLILPALLNVAELSTAMPRAGGAYFFLERAMGPMVGTIGGLGSWMALVLKSAFALLGMGAYLALFVDVPIVPLALVLTVVFTIVNLVGAKETAGMQRWLVYALVGILAIWMLMGAVYVAGGGGQASRGAFLSNGVAGFFATVGLVFVSYAGLTKVASIAEEVKDPDRNIPLGMTLALITATVVYGGGVWLMVRVLPFVELTGDLTPVATAGEVFLPGTLGMLAVVVAATAAFASTGNAGLMSSSRYPLAMARDRLFPPRFAKLGRTGTPVAGVIVSGGLMALVIVSFDVAAVAKLASAFQLLLFALLSVAVIVMRESRIDYYQPGFRSPLYPWVQIAGVLIPLWLIAQMGWLAVGFTGAVVVLCLLWYAVYVRGKVNRRGAVNHVFARLGRAMDRRLDHELRGLYGEKAHDDEDEFEDLVARAPVIELAGDQRFTAAVAAGVEALAHRVGLSPEALTARVLDEHRLGLLPVERGVALPHLRLPGLEHAELALVRVHDGVDVEVAAGPGQPHETAQVHALLVVISPANDAARHLRILARLATRVDDDGFLTAWRAKRSAAGLKELLLRDDRYANVDVRALGPTAGLVGRRSERLRLPHGARLAWVRCADGRVVREGRVLQPGDRLTIVGESDALGAVGRRFAMADAAG
ncbi:MAG: amino acid permease [Myxococcales bacterium]|nr:amino acid permease [Myxococcales bacterium]